MAAAWGAKAAMAGVVMEVEAQTGVRVEKEAVMAAARVEVVWAAVRVRVAAVTAVAGRVGAMGVVKEVVARAEVGKVAAMVAGRANA